MMTKTFLKNIPWISYALLYLMLLAFALIAGRYDIALIGTSVMGLCFMWVTFTGRKRRF